ncbi:MAG: ABC transporter permease [Nitriliruptoraceae bacterium]
MATPIPLRVLEGHARAYRHTWRGTTIGAIVTPVLFLAAMGLGLGQLVDDGGASPLPGVSYLTWLAPGLLAASAMQAGAADGTFPIMAGTRWVRTYHTAVASPVRPRDLHVGNLLWATLRVSVIGGVFVLVAAVFGAVPLSRGVLALAPAVLTGVAFCAALSAVVVRIGSDQLLSGLQRFVVVPLFLFSGTFFPVEQLPAAAATLARVLPLWHGVELTRALALGTAPALAWPVHLAVVLGLLLAGIVLGGVTFDRRLRP